MWILGGIGGAIILGLFSEWNVIAIIIGALIGALCPNLIGFIFKLFTGYRTDEEMEESNRRDRIREEYHRRHR